MGFTHLQNATMRSIGHLNIRGKKGVDGLKEARIDREETDEG